MSKTKESKIKDIYCGNSLQVWEDKETIYLSFLFNGVAIPFPREEWEGIKKEFKKISTKSLIKIK